MYHPSLPRCRRRFPAAIVLIASMAMPAWALTQAAGDKAAYDRARAEAAQQYDKALGLCAEQAVRDKDVCQITAKAERTKREALARALYEGTPQAAHLARLTMAQADLDASLRFCGQRHGSVSRQCKLEAREQFARAKAEADQALKDGQPIDKSLGVVKPLHPHDPRACDTLEGGAKHACLGQASGRTNPL